MAVTLKKKKNGTKTSEAFKILRTNIELAGSDKKAIVFTSCMKNEGKSTTSLSLAMELAEDGKKVLFIDADLRDSVMVGRCSVEGNIKGLSHYLSGLAAVGDVLQHTQDPRLHIIFAGVVPPNPAELLGNKKFDVLLAAARKTYDYIIIDATPLGSVIDAAVIAKKCDASVLVIAANEVSRRFAENVKDQLAMTGCPILGVVLNKVDMKQNKYYGKYYGHYGDE